MSDRLTFTLDPYGFATGQQHDIEYLSLDLPVEAVGEGGYASLSVTVERDSTGRVQLVISTDNLPGEQFGIKVVDGRGGSHDFFGAPPVDDQPTWSTVYVPQ